MKNTTIKFELVDDIKVLVVEDVSTSKPVVTLTTDEECIFLEEVACGGELLIISVSNKRERIRRYAIRISELLEHAKAFTRSSNKTWERANIKDLKKAGMYIAAY